VSAAAPVILENRGPTEQISSAPETPEFYLRAAILSESISAKLREAARPDLVERFQKCHRWQTRLTCRECGHAKIVWNRCESRWCPFCGPKLAGRRAEEILVWSRSLKQPKHVVLTQRNTTTISPPLVNHVSRALRRLRRRVWRPAWDAGTWTLEVTNEERGWHLHCHMLVETRWVDSPLLARRWAEEVGQEDYCIVSVKDARAKEYAREVAKYVCKPTEMSKWSGQEIAACIDAFNRRRSFGVVGRLSRQRKHWREIVRGLRHERAKCKCGECNWRLDDPELDGLGL
jgi:hypothetical protein